MGVLMEREVELARIEELLSQAANGAGSVLLVEGDPGIGKTELVHAAVARADAMHLQVMSARGSELEHEYGYGVVRQLLLPTFMAMPAGVQSNVLAGAAHLAGPVLGLGGPPDDGQTGIQVPDRGAVLHGLFWLAANIAARQPLLIAFDDAHWSDPPSMRFIAFLARRLEGVPILLLLSVRVSDAAGPAAPLGELASEPLTHVLRPRPLSGKVVTELIEASLAGPVDAGFARTCLRATGGVPFLVRELVNALAQDGIRPTAEATALIDRLDPQTVSRSTMLRLMRLGESAARAAEGVAVLGAHASTAHLSSLMRVPQPDLISALDALVSARILQPGQPVEFVHPLVRSSVYEDIPTYLRSDMHIRAADLIAAGGGDPEEVASHLVSAEPHADPRHADLLLRAAHSALARGAPDSAAAYLRRLLDAAPGGELRGQVLYELGRCEQAIRDPLSIPHLQAAIETMPDRRDRARATLALAESLTYVADLAGARAVLSEALGLLGGEDEDLEVRLRAMWAHVGLGDPRFTAEVQSELPRLWSLAKRSGPSSRELNVFLALITATSGQGTDRTLGLVQHGLDDGRLIRDETSDALAVAVAVNALVFIDELDFADELAGAMLDDARERGLVLGFIAGSAHRGLVALRKGELARAEAETRAALELAQQHELPFTIPFTLTYLGAAMLERGTAAEAAAMVDAVPLPPGFDQTLAGAMLRCTRGRLQLTSGDRTRGIADLRAAGDTFETIAMRNPNLQNWRAELALAIAAEDRVEATVLAQEELLRARRAGSARAIGIALRTSGLLKPGNDSIPELRESAEVLEHSPAKLEYARSLVDLGAALRRGNARSSAREPLRVGLELATRSGAGPLAERARRELLACGGRPRRMMITGRDALTPSEQRIAELAARGDPNRDIAQALFITPKTVENHLGRIYKKLGINAREQLPQVLAAEQPPD